jgi:16S rRNA (cytosine967-C5)-methyltransferase
LNQNNRSKAADKGLPARRLALATLQAVLFNERPLGEALDAAPRSAIEPRDVGFARAIAMTVLRRLGQIDAVLAGFLRDPLPGRAGPAEIILRMAAAEMLFLSVAPHASVSSAVDLAGADGRARHFKGLINAVARKIATEGPAALAPLDAERLNTPPWAWDAWTTIYGEETARAIAHAHLIEPPLDVTAKADAAEWATRLEAELLPTGTLRRASGGRIEDLPGYSEGAWWIQDAGSTLPVHILGDVRGQSVIDLCAAPGGKTAQLAAAGATVIAVDHAAERLDRLRENVRRLKLVVNTVTADAAEWIPSAPADAVLLDAPCTATGTARRHPDVLWRKDASDVLAQVQIQNRLIAAASRMVKPGGTLVYCVCSLTREEGEDVVEPFLANNPNFERRPLNASELGGEAQFITDKGDLRTLPSHWPQRGGIDGFYAARLRRKA